MNTKVLNGQIVRDKLFEQLKASVATMKEKPHLSVILVGEDRASQIYVNHKKKACALCGITTTTHALPKNTTEEALLSLIDTLNNDKYIHGILVQLPLPQHISTDKIISAIAINKDVDGFHPYNIGRLAQRMPSLRPCTPYGIIKLLDYYDIPLVGKNVTVVGVSNIVGRPLVLELLLAKATPTACHRFTKNLAQHINNADIVVSATGVRNVIDPEWISPDAIVIDVGIHRLPSGEITGDLDHSALDGNVYAMTPVPGGVGTMNVTVLLENTVNAFLLQQNPANSN